MEIGTRAHHGFIFKIGIGPAAAKVLKAFISSVLYVLIGLCSGPLAEEQAQQRLQAEEAEEQYQTALRMLNATTRKTQKKE